MSPDILIFLYPAVADQYIHFLYPAVFRIISTCFCILLFVVQYLHVSVTCCLSYNPYLSYNIYMFLYPAVCRIIFTFFMYSAVCCIIFIYFCIRCCLSCFIYRFMHPAVSRVKIKCFNILLLSCDIKMFLYPLLQYIFTLFCILLFLCPAVCE